MSRSGHWQALYKGVGVHIEKNEEAISVTTALGFSISAQTLKDAYHLAKAAIEADLNLLQEAHLWALTTTEEIAHHGE